MFHTNFRTILLIAAIACFCAVDVIAQSREATSRPTRPERRAKAAPGGGESQSAAPRRERDDDFRDGPQNVFARLPFGPTAADRGPLSDEELEELRPFVEQNLPMLARIIRHIQAADRPEMRKHLDQIAPFIRFLHRTSQENPRRARIMMEHVKSGFMLERARRLMASPIRGPIARERLQNDVRGAATRSVQAEIRLLLDYAQEAQDQFDDRADRRLTEVTADGADVSELPERIRDLIRRRQQANDQERPRFDRQIRAAIGDEMRTQIRTWRERAEELRSNTDAEVDRRVDEILGTDDSQAQKHDEAASDPDKPDR